MKWNKPLHKLAPEVFLLLIIGLGLIYTFFPPEYITYYLVPRTPQGLYGIVTSPFIHSNSEHLINNMKLFVPCSIVMLVFYRRQFIIALIVLQLTTGLFVWTFGKSDGAHVGYSGVAIGLFLFLIGSGFFSFQKAKILVSIILCLWQFFLLTSFWQQSPGISDDAHICGAISGVLVSWITQKPLQFGGELRI